jgi:hypothetical protein
MPDITSIANDLYALTPAEFTAERNRRARDAGDLSGQVRELPKPSAAAWGVNVFARLRADELTQLIELGELLRAAQDDADSNALQQLSKQRRALVAAMAREAASVAGERGAPVNAAAIMQIEQTLQAAMFDADAAAAVASGRLIRSLTSDGVEPVDLEGAVAGLLEGVRLPVRAAPIDLAAKRREVASRKADEAEQDSAAAQAEASDARTAADAATARHENLEAEIDDLRQQLEDMQREASAARKAASTLERDADAKQRVADRAAARAEEARAALNDLPAG